jgi:hypothetical protein
MSRWIPLGLGLALMVPSGMALAQTQPQPVVREDNIWGGKAHQPTESEVLQKEGVARLPSAQQNERASNRDVENLYRSLMGQSAQGR